MTYLTREVILQVKDLKTEVCPVPEWGGEVLVRGLTGTERDAFERELFEGEKYTAQNIRAKLSARCICDENLERIFTDVDIQALGGKSGIALDRVYDVATKLSGLGKKDIEDAVKK